MSPVKFIENPEDLSPIKKTIRKEGGLIISPERGNPFLNAATPSPVHKGRNARNNRGGNRAGNHDENIKSSGLGFTLISIKEDQNPMLKTFNADNRKGPQNFSNIRV